MRPLAIDFAPATLARSWRRTGLGAWLLMTLGLLLCASAAWSWYRSDQERSALQVQVERLEARWSQRAVRDRAAPARPVPEAQAQAVNRVIGQLNRPWGAMLDAVATAGAGSVALLELRPDPKNHQVNGLAEARNSGAMLAYIERLKQQAALTGARLTQHALAEQGAAGPIRFEFEAEWPGLAQSPEAAP